MANSLIEDVLNDPINDGENGKKPKKSKTKKSKKIIIFLIIIIIIIIACAVGFIYYLQNVTTEISSKAGFFEYLSSNNLESVTDFSSYETYVERLLDENSTSEINIDIAYESEDLSISNLELNLETESDIQNSKSYINAVLSYSDNDLFEFEILTSSDSVALKSDEVVTAYVSIPYEYIYSEYFDEDDISSDVVSVFDEVGTNSISVTDEDSEDSDDEENVIVDEDEDGVENVIADDSASENTVTNETDTDDTTNEVISDDEEEIDVSTTDDTDELSLDAIWEMLENLGSISDETIELYENIIDKNLDDTHFSSSNVSLTLDIGEVNATQYTLIMTRHEFINILKECLETLETDTNTIESLSEILSIMGITEEDFVNNIDDLILELEEYYNDDGTDEDTLEISVYESDGQTVEIVVKMLESGTAVLTFEIQYEYDSSENSIKLSYIDEDSDGLSCKITNTVSDLSNKIDVTLSLIETNEVTGSVTLSLNLVGSNDIYTLDTGIFYKDTDSNSIDVDITTETEFTDDVEVEDITDENSVSIEDLDDEQLEAINEQLESVLNSKLSELSFIDTNTNTTTIEQSDSETDEEDETKKEEAKNDLIAAVQEAMNAAVENEEEYTIEDLLDLEIDDLGDGEYEAFGVSISSDIATITIDEYIFYIDSDFNLTE